MASTAIIGAQWGDEGKAKIIDRLASSAQMVVRTAGGNNAGHTVAVQDQDLSVSTDPLGDSVPGCNMCPREWHSHRSAGFACGDAAAGRARCQPLEFENQPSSPPGHALP